MCEKLPYAYKFVQSENNYYKPKFPIKSDYNNDLNEEKCKLEDFQRVLEVRKKFNCKIYKDEHDLYLKLDVLLLTNVFKYFRNACFQFYELDFAWCYTLFGFN